jgi:hypothetical protein
MSWMRCGALGAAIRILLTASASAARLPLFLSVIPNTYDAGWYFFQHHFDADRYDHFACEQCAIYERRL